MLFSSLRESLLSKENLRKTDDNFDVYIVSCLKEDLNALLHIISLPV